MVGDVSRRKADDQLAQVIGADGVSVALGGSSS
jgi:hypothetical protein